MTEQLIGTPRKVASLDQRGLDKVLEMAQQDTTLARAAAASLAQDPRGFIEHTFRLSAEQRSGLQNIAEADLVRLGRVLAAGLTADPARVEVSYQLMPLAGGDMPQALKCSFKAKVGKDGVSVEGSLETGGGGKKAPQEKPKKE